MNEDMLKENKNNEVPLETKYNIFIDLLNEENGLENVEFDYSDDLKKIVKNNYRTFNAKQLRNLLSQNDSKFEFSDDELDEIEHKIKNTQLEDAEVLVEKNKIVNNFSRNKAASSLYNALTISSDKALAMAGYGIKSSISAMSGNDGLSKSSAAIVLVLSAVAYTGGAGVMDAIIVGVLAYYGLKGVIVIAGAVYNSSKAKEISAHDKERMTPSDLNFLKKWADTADFKRDVLEKNNNNVKVFLDSLKVNKLMDTTDELINSMISKSSDSNSKLKLKL